MSKAGYYIYTGVLLKAESTTTTSIHSEGGETYITDRSTAIRIYSSNHTVWNFWLQGERDERHFQLKDHTVPVREGQILSLLLNKERIIAIFNHNTGVKHSIPRSGIPCGCIVMCTGITCFAVAYLAFFVLFYLQSVFSENQMHTVVPIVFWLFELPAFFLTVGALLFINISIERDYVNAEMNFIREVESYRFKR